ncbi:MAG: 23S rRNA (uracil(1939)-C(5))-methyltransferase RlmD [Fidelibacterota bacterium]|nr:MAG: 23S rRNA (uracil(1939)-C(5))-methyltransferase RlmD [Candidatus Neomarinimicrobiota bacterium]
MSEAPVSTFQSAPRLPRKGELLDLTIDSLAYGGKGVARQDGFVVFVQRGLPGQKVRARIIKRRSGFAEARVEELLEPSPDAVEPRCAHFGVCGGCATQDYSYQKQLEQKQAQVKDLFARLGGFADVQVQPIIGCHEIYHYRNKMEFTFSPNPWIVDLNNPGNVPSRTLGLHVPGRFDKVLDIHECWLQHPMGNNILQWIKAKVEEHDLEPYDIKAHKGFLRHLVIRTARSGSTDNIADSLEVMVNLVTSREEPQRLKSMADELVVAFPQVVSVVNNINTRKAAVAYGEREILLNGKPTISEELRGLAFDISANSFFQTNTRQAEVIYELIEQACALSGQEVVYDLYCGTGTIALTLARTAKEVAGFEVVSSAVEDAARNAIVNEIYNARFFHADLSTRYFTTQGKRLQQQVAPPDVVVSDPPRAGMHPKLVEEVITLEPGRMVYLSCNPATQVRDMRLMCDDGYRVVTIQPVDMFPHTPHIENLCVLEK